MNLGIVITIMFCGAFITGLIASSKGRSGAAWATFGALFPLIALIAIACVPSKVEEIAP